MQKTSFLKPFVSLFMILCILPPFLYISGKDIPQQQIERFSRRIAQSKDVLEKFANDNNGIPKEVLKEAKAIAIFPRVTKFKYFLGKTFGKGVVSRKTYLGWSAPVSFEISSKILFGFGINKSNIVLIFISDEATQKLKQSKIELGKDVTIAEGPRKSNSSSVVIPKEQVLAYDEKILGFSPTNNELATKLNGTKLEPIEEETKAINCGFGTIDTLFPQNDKVQVCASKNESSNGLRQSLNNLEIKAGRCICNDIKISSETDLTKLFRQEYPTKSNDVIGVLAKLKEALNAKNLNLSYFEPEQNNPFILETPFVSEINCRFDARTLWIKFRFEISEVNISKNKKKVQIIITGLVCSSSGSDIITTFNPMCDNSGEKAFYNGSSCMDNFYNRIVKKIGEF